MSSAAPRSHASDDKLRSEVLSPRQSWMLQAPAGSGKTELLMQRFLACLAEVEQPESVLAITFTRKAAAEMRTRILAALETAATGDDVPATELEPHKQRSLELARRALKASEDRGWNLLSHPSRLQIRTLDSFCEAVAQRTPLKGMLGGVAEVTEDAQPLYKQAADRVLQELASPGARGEAVAVLLQRLDADVSRAKTELAQMLARREQWLYLLGRSDAFDNAQQQRLKQQLEEALVLSVEEELRGIRAQVASVLSPEQEAELFDLMRYRAEQVAEGQDASAPTVDAIAASAELSRPLHGIEAWPDAVAENIGVWSSVAEFLLTKEGKLRKSVNKNQGFLPGTTAKERMTDLLKAMKEPPASGALPDALHRARTLPEPHYSDAQWKFLLALLELLPLAAAHLQLVFAERGVIDFAEYAQRALDALGDEAGKTELGLQLGYRIRHILVDEFQDTNRVQVELLERLVDTWEEDEDCSTFLVGDPMQSIYAFRQADVAIYQRVRREGIGGREQQFGRLRKNFRSQAKLVQWFNQTFAGVFRQESDATNAVSYAEADEVNPALDGTGVEMRGFAKGDRRGEARHMAACIQRELDEARQAGEELPSIAVLVRARSHLPELVEALREAGIGFRAVKTDRLSERPLVRDLEALRTALCDLADRTAWLAVLRAPWCGLALADLLELCRGDEGSTVRELLRQREERLSPEARAALGRCLPVLDDALARCGRGGLRSLVESTWLRLGGPAALPPSDCDPGQAARDAETYFSLLDELGATGSVPDPEHFASRLNDLFAPPDSREGIHVEITTIHNAKGLEWDIVFLPALERPPRGEDKRLLYLRSRRREADERLLLGTMEANAQASPGKKNNGTPSIETYLRKLDNETRREESKRLLYVAATRARRRLYLSATLDAEKRLKASSLLSLLWDLGDIKAAFALPAESASEEEPEVVVEEQEPVEASVLRRLPPSLSQPPAPSLEPALPWNPLPEKGSEDPHRFEWVGELLPRVGEVAHSFLERIAIEGLEHWNAARLERVHRAILATLRHRGVRQSELERGAGLVADALRKTLDDERGRWLLSPHPEHRCELALSAVLDGRLQHVRIDRTFLEDGSRWLVDYKITVQSGGDLERFLAMEVEKYRPDLLRYARVLRGLENDVASPLPLRCALYFPLLGEFREIEHGAA
jgi:ATP-dependent helicase/nuclease subunit A